jgi:hypothetical protein
MFILRELNLVTSVKRRKISPKIPADEIALAPEGLHHISDRVHTRLQLRGAQTG